MVAVDFGVAWLLMIAPATLVGPLRLTFQF
jgi:hypothetical protein